MKSGTAVWQQHLFPLPRPHRTGSQVQSLEGHLGPILFQLPPYARKDTELLREFCGKLPQDLRAAFEFRHPSWVSEDVHEVLAGAGCALCAADTDKDGPGDTAMVPTTNWGYLRLRQETYNEAELATWAEWVRRQPWQEVFVFFKHEDRGTAPKLAEKFAPLLTGS